MEQTITQIEMPTFVTGDCIAGYANESFCALFVEYIISTGCTIVRIKRRQRKQLIARANNGKTVR